MHDISSQASRESPTTSLRIAVFDGSEEIDMVSLYEDYMVASSQEQTIDVSGKTFNITHIKLKTSAHQRPFVAWCASSRVLRKSR